jgi:uncharacterized heparinase superfamily protein
LTKSLSWRDRRTHFMHRYHARRIARGAPVTAFVSQPEPRTIGHLARGRQLIAGNFLFSGLLVESKDQSIWDIAGNNDIVSYEIQGCQWLDDLAAVGDTKARLLAQEWVHEWITRFGAGKGSGWTPDLVGKRLIRWINHGFLLLRGQDKEHADAFFRSLSHQALFLARRWKTSHPGLPRFEALTGMIYAGLSLEGMEQYVPAAVAVLAQDCAVQIDDEGGIATRNPEELLEVFTLLTWAAHSLGEAGQTPPIALIDAINRIAPTLRALRHSDGGLARFHGGGRGLEGRLDHALANATIKSGSSDGLHMGFARHTAGRTSLVIDAQFPPKGAVSGNAHASTLAFELTSGRRPIIVNCGSGHSFGDEWRRAGRATASHSTLSIEGYSSSRLAAPGRVGTRTQELLEDIPNLVHCEFSALYDGRRVELSHDGYQHTHGLTHARTFDIAVDGRGLVGEDILTTLNPSDNRLFDRALDQSKLKGVPFALRFHLHPDVEASIDLGGGAVSLTLKSGEVWIFRQDGSAEMTLKPSVYLENGRLKPRGTQQVVLSARAIAYATRVRWSLAKAQDTPNAVRDLVTEDQDLAGPHNS